MKVNNLPDISPSKVTIGGVDDPLEREANRVADQIMRMHDPSASPPVQVHRQWIARQKNNGHTTSPGEDRKSLNVGPVVRATRRGGVLLPPALRSFFEPRFGVDFGRIRVHAGAEAADSARAVQARAYTLGHHIVFGEGEYATATQVGRYLLAHELTHYVQQGVAGSPPTQVRRFASFEHKSLGDEVAAGRRTDINIGTDTAPNYLTFGDAVALAGDYFGSLARMYELARTEAGRAKLRWAYWWALGKDQGMPEPPLSDAEKQEIKDNYFTLASQNVSHFSAGGTAGSTYQDQHTKALRMAFETGRAVASTGSIIMDLTVAQTQEAFAQHFLSDMFSAGHVRTERMAIKAWYDTNMPHSIPQFITYMARKMHAYLTHEHNVADFFGMVPSEAELQERIRTIGGKALQAFSLGDIVSLAYHNYDSLGLDVTSEADQQGKIKPGGSPWRAMGDAMLDQSPITRKMAVAAMRASLSELDVMYKKGLSAPPGVLPDGGFSQALSSLGNFAALKYVPRATATNRPMKWMWGFLNQRMYDAVDAAVKNDIVQKLREISATQKDANVRAALDDFANLLEILGISAIEQAVGEPAKQKRYPLPGMYGYQPPGPDD